jgi:hypothetical protein
MYEFMIVFFVYLQELELEVEQSRKEHAQKVKEMQDAFDEEKDQIRNDMATVLQVSLSPGFSEQYSQQESRPESEQIQEQEQKIIKLEQELSDLEARYQEEMQMEKEAHQRDMEDTIRDVL